MIAKPTILVTGSTGYIGGRLVPLLVENNYQVRVLVRDPQRLQGRQWLEKVEVFQGDVMQPESLAAAFEGVSVAYYLVHSMAKNKDFHERDVIAAGNFGRIAREKKVDRIIYLGGLGDPDSELSPHLRSRQQTAEALRAAGNQVTEFRAGVVVGSGSLSFEMIRYLTERIPVMVCPKWVFSRIQPIAIDDVLSYLIAALDTPASVGQTIEIGGEDVLTYGEMMLEYARARGLKRYLLPVPVLTPYLSSYWVHWMTPIPATMARPLIEGLRNEVIVRSDTAAQIFPAIRPIKYSQAVADALNHLETGQVMTIWSDALASSQGDRSPVFFKQEQGLNIESRRISVNAPQQSVYETFSQLGGEKGWLAYNFLWDIRGLLDRMLGGVGMRRGRRHPKDIRIGDAVDFWRVESVLPGSSMRLRAEMIVPGKAWLQFETSPLENSKTELIQTAFFFPKGLLGLIYWYGLYPIHALIFGTMIKKIARSAEQQQAAGWSGG